MRLKKKGKMNRESAAKMRVHVQKKVGHVH
jgi:hypothetical protein